MTVKLNPYYVATENVSDGLQIGVSKYERQESAALRKGTK